VLFQTTDGAKRCRAKYLLPLPPSTVLAAHLIKKRLVKTLEGQGPFF
jgi:hypothetical protein